MSIRPISLGEEKVFFGGSKGMSRLGIAFEQPVILAGR
jgi:hypothetical protein